MDDKQILELIKHNKTRDKGFALLVNQTKERIYWSLRKMVLSHDDANDVLQEIYIKVFKNISSFKQDSSLTTWIYRIATNECINFLKSKNKKKELLNIEIEKAYNIIDTNNTNLLNPNELASFLDEAVKTLPDKQKQVFCLRYYDNMPFNDMADKLNTSKSALKTSYYIAENKIREFLLSKQLNF